MHAELLSILSNALGQMPSGTGGQLSLRCSEGTWDVVSGTGQTGAALRQQDLHPGYCLTRPLLAIASGILVDRFDLVLSEPIGLVELLDGVTVLLDCSVEDVLSHQVGLTGPTAFEWRALDWPDLVAAVASVTSTGEPSYSEVMSGLAIEAIIQRHTGVDATDWVARQVLEPLSLSADICMDPALLLRARAGAELQVPVGGDRSTRYPLLSELLAPHLQRTRLAFGAWITARGLADLYWRWITSLERSELTPGLPRPETSRSLLAARPGFHDPSQGHDAQYSAGGLVVDLARAGVCTTATPRAFGHPGGFSTSFGLADLDPPISIGAYLNGIIDNFDDLAAVRSEVASQCLDLVR